MENCLQINAPVPPKPPPTPPKEGRNKWGNDLKTKISQGAIWFALQIFICLALPSFGGVGEIISLEGREEELFVSVLS